MWNSAERGAVSISFTYTEEEYIRAVRMFYERAYHTRFNFLLGSFVALLGALGVAAGFQVLFPAVCLAVGSALLALHGFAYFVTPRRHYESNPKLRERYELDFHDEGILFRSKGVESRLEWGLYSKVLETAEFYLLMYGKDMFTVIPKRAFRDQLHENVFRELLRRKLGPPVAPRELPSTRARKPEPDYRPPASPPDWR